MGAQLDGVGAVKWVMSRIRNDLLDWDDPKLQAADARLQEAVGEHLLAVAEYARQATCEGDTYSIRLLSHYSRMLLNVAVEEMARLHGVDLDDAD
jgi:hypothetical protein